MLMRNAATQWRSHLDAFLTPPAKALYVTQIQMARLGDTAKPNYF